MKTHTHRHSIRWFLHFLVVLLCANGANAQSVLRGPYLQNGTPDGVSIMWRTDVVTNGRVWTGTDPANLNQIIDEPTAIPAVIPRGATWEYLDDGSDQSGTSWKTTSGGWSSGPAELGYGDGGEATVVNSGGTTKFITTYFRHPFNVADPTTISALDLGLQRDDGGIVYLNGTEIRRDRMPSGPITSSTFADSPAVGGGDESIFYVTSLTAAQLALLVPGNNIIAVEIHQQATTSSDISFDLELYEPQQGGGGNGLDHLVRISGLPADSTYYYQIGTDTNVVLAGGDLNHFFKTSPTVGSTQPVRVWVLGDSGTADNNARLVRDAYLELAQTEVPTDLWLMLGDNAYQTGTDTEYQNAVFQNMYEDILINKVLWSTQGNHDVSTYFEVFDLPVAGEGGGVASGTEDYYSFDYGNIHFICLSSQDTNLSGNAGSAMYTWLNADLVATAQPWIVAFFHHPPYTKGSHDSDNTADSSGRMTDMREIALPILESGGVDLVLAGHSHSYERSKFINGHYGTSGTFNANTHVVQSGDGDPSGNGAYLKPGLDGAVYITAGSSGKISGVTQHNAMQVWHNVLGSVVIDVTGDQMDVSFLRETTNPVAFDDHFTISKNFTPDTTPPAPDPMTWAAVPTAVDSSSITMTATTATDASGVQYFFENVFGGGNDSGWQSTASYMDTGLSVSTTYTYRVKARDTSTNQNETVFSTSESATTNASGPESLFSDGFESGSFASGGWTTQNGSAAVKGSAAFTGSVGAELKKTTWIEKALSTEGYGSIELHYARQTSGLDANEWLYVEWSPDGQNWIEPELEKTKDQTYTEKAWMIPLAEDQLGFRIRFKSDASANNEKARIDDVEIIGTPLGPPVVPGTASAPAPGTGATGVSISSSLSWTAGSGAESHDVYFGTTASPAFQGNQADTSYSPTLSFSTTYFWRVDEVNTTGTTTGIVWTFTTEAAPPLPDAASNPNPANGATDIITAPVLSWNAGSNTTSHDVYFGTANPPTLQTNQTGTSYTPGPLDSNETYFWSIDERNGTGITPGPVWSFTTATNTGPEVLFEDDFESGNFTAGGWTTLNGNANVRGSAAFTGSNGAELKSSTSIQKTFSTVGYHSITLFYARRTQKYDNGEVLSIQWSDGSTWHDVEPPAQHPTYLSEPFTLDAGAADNANFAIRFLTNANANNEKAGVDVVEVTGIAGTAN
ncbi:MAG: hypothetical protein ACI9R3_006091 [Verrucomicrobiales bacterium]|jgi:hypothetical protein